MLDLEKLADRVSSQLGNLVIQSSRCSRVRSRLSNCNACQDTCQFGEFSWTENELHIKKCIDCGICTVSCPTGALSWRFPSPRQLIAKVSEIQEVYREATIYCSQHAPGKSIPSTLEVSCLNSIPWECWLYLLLINKIQIYYPKDCCSTCAAVPNSGNSLEQLEKAQRLAGQQIPRVLAIQRVKKIRTSRPVDKGRRQLFAALVGGLAKLPESMFNDALNAGESAKKILPEKSMLTERRQVLLSLLEKRPQLAETISLQFPAAAAGECTFCGACSSLCPLGALRQKNAEDGEVFLELDTRLCTGCKLCAEICFHSGLELATAAADSWYEPVRVLFQGSTYSCPDCGDTFVAETGGKCPACQNNRIMFASQAFLENNCSDT